MWYVGGERAKVAESASDQAKEGGGRVRKHAPEWVQALPRKRRLHMEFLH